ncbi:helix-turn-helix transcriptional regulator [Streptomyces daliensis]|uniref:Helix-turn-helix transcriptional regulator n=1 Tax=Streptomyces daliensis TaxID=299421 RepID=A0A8T4IIB5_9ACTN|nr:helix-turn-helix transcriptional regulator [Streptomyces daliensis]
MDVVSSAGVPAEPRFVLRRGEGAKRPVPDGVPLGARGGPYSRCGAEQDAGDLVLVEATPPRQARTAPHHPHHPPASEALLPYVPRTLLAQIRAYIAGRLGDAELTPEVIASAHHISLRYLHKLFQQDGHTVAGWIRERRLEQCRRDLANPQLTTRPIHVIAARWGFTNAAHFSQVFRGAYGLSPRQFRQHCAAMRAA